MFVLFVLTLLNGASAISNATVDDIPEAYLDLSSGNSLWTALLRNCRQPTADCVEKNVYDYLKGTVEEQDDVQVTSFMKFIKNRVGYRGEGDSEEDVHDGADGGPRSSLEEMSRSLHDASVKFLMNHDMELQLPEAVFEGSTLKVSPREFQGNGTLVHIEFIPKDLPEGVAEGRIFKKIKHFISDKLMYALMAILLVIKLLAAKFMFFLPMMVGAVTAKKLLVKVLLFLFPALHHLFKFCAYVPHGAKLHHHKHHISHIHHIAHHPPKHHHHHHGHHDHVEVIRPHAAGPPHLDGPTSLHHSVDEVLEGHHKPFYNPHEQELEYYAGPALSHELISHRKDPNQDENEVQPWGQGQRKKPVSNRPLTPPEIEAMVLKAEQEARLKARLQAERHRIQEENARLQEQLRLAMKLQEKLKQQAATVKASLPAPPSTRLQTPSAEVRQVYAAPAKQEDAQKKKVQSSAQAAFEKALHQAASITYDPFYSPILEKIDQILAGLGFNDEPCRERLICSMYKNPKKFSPHSNLLSAELSRDSSELQKPTSTNAAVIRFYRYVQAARDGQDKRECLRLFPACPINTEQ